MLIEKLGLSKNVLINKVAIITGAGRGIGKELARALAWLGAKVVIAEINEYGKDVEDLICSEGGTALFVKTDVSKEEDIKKLENIVIERFGKVNILINNAYATSAGTINEISIEDWDRIYNVNIRGTVHAIKTFLPYMIKQNDGVINTVTSAEGWPYMAPYFATKTALTSIGISLAAELDNANISVFVFGPGMIDTPGLQEYSRILAPKYGITEEEFKNQGVNPGYDGLMPADHCAAGWAYTIVYAKEYHGQIAEPFSPLLKLGLICPKKKESSFKEKKMQSETDLKIFISEIIENSKNVHALIEKLYQETNDLGLLAKKWMNRTFAKRCGMKIEKCVETITELDNVMQKIPNNIHNQKEDNSLPIIKKLPWFIQVLEKLADHFHKCLEDAKGWIKDPDELKIALKALNNREKTVLTLISNLSQVESIL
ncbi:MAG: SDR family oxidoreductase [Candidatus Lokiarchaeota archaeon]|nr:SDR family oxidoreductase [Candidatus Lokiarchaeota archaeon]